MPRAATPLRVNSVSLKGGRSRRGGVDHRRAWTKRAERYAAEFLAEFADIGHTPEAAHDLAFQAAVRRVEREAIEAEASRRGAMSAKQRRLHNLLGNSLRRDVLALSELAKQARLQALLDDFPAGSPIVRRG